MSYTQSEQTRHAGKLLISVDIVRMIHFCLFDIILVMWNPVQTHFLTFRLFKSEPLQNSEIYSTYEVLYNPVATFYSFYNDYIHNYNNYNMWV